jgi:hypothetical protein
MMGEKIDLSSKMKSYAVMAQEIITAMPSNEKEVRAIYKESEQIFLIFARAHQNGDMFDKANIVRFLQIGNELLGWHDTMTGFQKCDFPMA